MTERIAEVNIFKYRVKIVIYDDLEEAKKKYVEMGDKYDGMTYGLNGLRSIVVCPKEKLSCIVHELEHAKGNILADIGHKPDYRNDEIDAYIMGWLFEQVEKTIDIHNKRNKKEK